MKYLRAKVAVRQTAKDMGFTEAQYAEQVRLSIKEVMGNADALAQKEWERMFPNGIDGIQCYEIIDRLARYAESKRTHRFKR